MFDDDYEDYDGHYNDDFDSGYFDDNYDDAFESGFESGYDMGLSQQSHKSHKNTSSSRWERPLKAAIITTAISDARHKKPQSRQLRHSQHTHDIRYYRKSNKPSSGTKADEKTVIIITICVIISILAILTAVFY